MFKTRKSKDMAKRIAALTLAFLMVFQYTASGLSIYAWAETDEETQQEEQLEKESEVTEETGPEEEVKEGDKEEPSKPSDASEPEKEPEKKDEQKKDDKKVEYPATSFDELVSGVTVRIDAPEGALPEGATVVIEAKSLKAAKKVIADTTGDDVKVVKALDISFRDAEGKEIEPHEKVAVNFECGKFEDIRSPVVYHITDEGVAEKLEEETVAVYGSQVSINSKEFSEYVIGEDQNATEEETEEPTRAGETDSNAETWTVTFYNRDAQVHETVKVVKGQAIGDQLPATIAREDYTAYWAIGEIVQGGQGKEIKVTGERINSSFVPEADTEIVPDYDQIEYTITFYKEDKTTVVATKTVTSNTSYCLNDIPAVPTKEGHVGKWVYEGGDFSNSVAVSKDTSVWAEYEKNVFTVTYKVEGETYETDTYYTGDELTLPTEPVVEGKQFTGWYVDDTKYEGGEEVKSDLTLAAKFENEFYVNFVVLDDDGETEIERLSQYFRTAGDTIGTMPQDPFVAGKVFEKWVIKGTDTEVTADTVVTGNMTVEAKFRAIDVYNITAEYYYLNDDNEEVVFNTDLLQVETHELPYTITAPSTTQTSPDEVSGGPIYYPETPSAEIKESDFGGGHNYTVRFKYVPYTAEYDFVYKVKDLTGTGYTEIPDSREHVYGVLNSYVTPNVKSFDHYDLELAEGANITQVSGQELVVKYTRKSYQLTYDTKGGSYIAGTTVPYGTSQEVTSTVPTRAGYTFAGWYTDPELTNAAGSTVTVNSDITLYAKWTGDTVDYTIVYMFEKYNDAGTESDFVYDNSETGRGTVGSTVYANDSSIPDKTKKGWEEDTARNAQSKVEITADGSAVLLVYYKLRTYTFTFTINGNSTNGRYRMTIKGTTYRADRDTKYSFTAKLGQDISADWPINGGSATIWDNNNGYYFYYWSCQGTRYASKILRVTEELLPNNSTNVAVTGYWRSSNSTVQVNYYLQNADNDGYTLSTLYSQTAPSGSYSPKAIAGYTFDHEDNDTSWGTVTAYNFYYRRHTYQIEYYHGNDKLKTISNVKYDATITGNTYNWTPTQEECDVEDDYTWGGWYDNAGCEGTPYTFSKMPAGATNGSVALVLYAKWNAPSYTVQFIDGDDTETQLAPSKTVEKHKKVTAPETTPTKDGYVFEGWYKTADGDERYDWNNQITEDTTVYAHWSRKTLSYTVHYVDDTEEHNPVASDKVVTNPNYVVGQTITEQAIAVAGYRPQKNSDTVTLAMENNVITFVYSKKAEKTAYTVRYVIAEGEPGAGTAVAEEKTVEDVPGDTASVIELAKAVDYSTLYDQNPDLAGIEFFPDEVEKTLVLTANAEENVLTFYYSSFKNAKITVNFVDMDGNSIATSDTQIKKVGNNYTLARTPVEGWELNKAVIGTEYDGTAAGTDYKITDEIAHDGGLTFTLFYQKKVTVTANSLSKQYDGEALTLPDELAGQVKVTGLPEGESLTSIEFTYTNTDNTTKDGRINAGAAIVTPKNAVTDKEHAENYYAFRYISGTLEVTKINVTVRIEPDRWVGNIYDGTEKITGFTNSTKTTPDKYVMISHAGYNNLYLNDIWTMITELDNVKLDGSTPGMHYYVLDEKNVCDKEYTLDINASDLPDGNGNYSVSLYVRPGRLQILPKEITVKTGTDENHTMAPLLLMLKQVSLDSLMLTRTRSL